MTSMTSMPPDVIHEILVLLSDFSTLSAIIRTCKRFYDVFQSHTKLITYAVLQNAAGPALGDAKRLDYYGSTHSLPEEGYLDSGEWELNRDTAMRMERRGRHIRTLEDFFSLRYKDRTSLYSKLDALEQLRFHRAVYRYWLCYEILRYDALREQDSDSDNEEEDEDEDDDDDHDIPPDDLGLNKEQRRARDSLCDALGQAHSDELFELVEICAFLKGTEVWQERTVSPTSSIHPVPYWTTVNPEKLAESLQNRQMRTDYYDSSGQHELVSNAARNLLRAHKIPNDRLSQAPVKVIVTSANGADDRCSRCQAVCGTELLGPTNMHLLSGILPFGDKLSLLPGLLYKNRDEMRLLDQHVQNHGNPIPVEVRVRQMMEMEPEGEDADNEHWSIDEWYCLDCIKTLHRQRLMLWWREEKKKSGVALPDDCWYVYCPMAYSPPLHLLTMTARYGYNCRTMTHRSSHALKLNHLCKPTRGDAPNAAPASIAILGTT
ncbi:hypothetical protein FKP32DRAFT_1616450 [Trametes sanguinea]|nr:hypothetical protein FKP32DRAFT_1616450 [Trametes sanguinea]